MVNAAPSSDILQGTAECPFCSFKDSEYIVLLHIESEHTDNSPFVAHDPTTSFNPVDYGLGTASDEVLVAQLAAQQEEEEETTYVLCPEDGCEEPVLLLELQNHLDFHAAENISMEDAQGAAGNSSSSRTAASASARKYQNGDVSYVEPESVDGEVGWITKAAKALVGPAGKQLKMSNLKKLGKSDLGPYAQEKQMPAWLRKQLEQGGKVITQRQIDPATGRLVNVVQIENETPGLIPVIGMLCERDRDVTRAWLCHPGVKHVGKQIKGEGGFCGYRNIQMLISYIQASEAYPRGSHPFEGRLPTILKLQELIEHGWDTGINVNGRAETGGIYGTRKYIGTSEAQTLFTSLHIRSYPRSFNKSHGHPQQSLLSFVKEYFSSVSVPPGYTGKVVHTNKPPIYFQHSGHSMTIIGLEQTASGSLNLLVFDPFFTPSEPMKNLIGGHGSLKARMEPEKLLKAYRRRMNYLKKYREFEIIVLER